MQIIHSAHEMLHFGQGFSKQLKPGDVVFLKGELGAGKTTFVRGILAGFGYHGVVKSPTYTLVESYFFETMIVHHFDLYRLRSVEELEMMGFADYVTPDAILLIEWPEKVKQGLPKATVTVSIESKKGKSHEGERAVEIK